MHRMGTTMIKRRGSLLSLMEYPNSQTWKPNRNVIFREGDFVNSVIAPGILGVVRKVDDFIHKVYVQWNGGELIQMEPEYLTLVPFVDEKLRQRFAPAGEVDVKYKAPEVNRGYGEGQAMTWNPDGVYEPANPDLDYKKYMKTQDSAYRDHAYEHAHLNRQEFGPKGRADLKRYYNKLNRGEEVQSVPEIIQKVVDADVKGSPIGGKKCPCKYPVPTDDDGNFPGSIEQQAANEILEHGILGKKAKTASKRRPNVFLAKEVKERKLGFYHPMVCPGGQETEKRFSMENEMLLRQIRDDVKDVLSFSPGVNPDVEFDPIPDRKTHGQTFQKKPGKFNGDPEKSQMLQAVTQNVFNKIRGLKKK